MSEDDIRDAVEGAEETGACPVTALGHSDQKIFWYVASSGAIVGLRPGAHKKEQIDALFGGRVGWLIDVFPAYGKDGKPIRAVNYTQARRWLFQECLTAGFFQPDRDLRGPGAWRDEDGDLILHCGDEVLIDGQWRRAGFRDGGFVYPRGRAEPRPGKAAAPAALGRELVGFLEAWNWISPPGPDGKFAPALFVGWLGCAMICGALEWRPHIMVTGGRGTGKTTLDGLAAAILGAGGMLKASAPTEAGVRQALMGSARPVMLDEIEHDGESRRSKDLQNLARLGSTDGQGDVLRGSAEGRSMSFPIRACFYFSAILHAAFDPADASRITVLELGDLRGDPEASRAVRTAIAEFGAKGAALRARMIAGYERFLVNLSTHRDALASHGATLREGEQLGTLFASHDVLTTDHPSDPEVAADIASRLIVSDYVPDSEDDGATQCLGYLQSSTIDASVVAGAPRVRRSVGEAVRMVIANPYQNSELHRVLKTHGIAVMTRQRPVMVCVANRHRGLEKLFEGSRWERGVWSQDLRRVYGAEARQRAVRFAGMVSRAVWLPVVVWPELDDERDDPPATVGKADLEGL